MIFIYYAFILFARTEVSYFNTLWTTVKEEDFHILKKNASEI